MIEGLMNLVLDLRQLYRKNENWSQADYIRSQLSDLGIVVNDGPEGSSWQLDH
jgi:cysteinyl-tRNA synthetase